MDIGYRLFTYINCNYKRHIRLFQILRSEAGLKASIGVSKTEIALSELIDVPRFLRYYRVSLVHYGGSQSIAQKRESFRGYLPSIKASLYDSNIIGFYCRINQEDLPDEFSDPSEFSDHSAAALLEYIRQIVSICDSPRGYWFEFHRLTDSDAFGNVIASILEMPAIARSSNVCICSLPVFRMHFPVEAISNWLNRERHVMDRNQRERTLLLSCYVQDACTQTPEMCDFLKKVFFLYFRIFSLELFIL